MQIQPALLKLFVRRDGEESQTYDKPIETTDEDGFHAVILRRSSGYSGKVWVITSLHSIHVQRPFDSFAARTQIRSGDSQQVIEIPQVLHVVRAGLASETQDMQVTTIAA